MKAVGIICEYSPFHNGHLYHIQKVKELYPNHKAILILSGNFTQRGLVSILNKWDKTSIALHYGVDLVIELPFVFATQSADIFAHGAIQLLNELKVEYLVFGSESNDIDSIKNLASIQLNDNNYQKKVKEYLDNGENYPTALSKALKDISGKTITLPNDLLGISYVKEIIRTNSNIIPVSIKRTNDFHSIQSDNEFMSATGIRKLLKDGKDICKYVPSETINILRNHIYNQDDYYKLLKYQIILNENKLSTYQTVDEGLDKRIINSIFKSNSYEELVNNIKTKRNTYNKIMRMLTHILIGFTKEEASKNQDISYIRILGFNKNGQAYLNEIKKDIKYPIVKACNEIEDDMLKIELRSTKVYANTVENNELIQKEYSKMPIIK